MVSHEGGGHFWFNCREAAAIRVADHDSRACSLSARCTEVVHRERARLDPTPGGGAFLQLSCCRGGLLPCGFAAPALGAGGRAESLTWGTIRDSLASRKCARGVRRAPRRLPPEVCERDDQLAKWLTGWSVSASSAMCITCQINSPGSRHSLTRLESNANLALSPHPKHVHGTSVTSKVCHPRVTLPITLSGSALSR